MSITLKHSAERREYFVRDEADTTSDDVTISPRKLILHINDGHIWMAVADGPRIRKDGKHGVWRSISWGRHDPPPPAWVADVVASTLLPHSLRVAKEG